MLLPGWIEALDKAAFGETFGPLGEKERLITIGEQGFARWNVLVVAEEAELLRIAVDPQSRRAGLGRRLLEQSEEELSALGITQLFLEVRESNLAARALYLRCGFFVSGRRKEYYRDGEAAVLYAKHVGPR